MVKLFWLAGPIFVLHLLATNLAAQDAWGNLSGRILVSGKVSAPSEENVDKDAVTCMPGGTPPLDDNLIVGADGGLKDVFVMLFLDRGDKPPPIHPDYEVQKDKPVVLDNVQCRFEPHAIFVRTGQKLVLKNSDDVGHNCHVITFGNEENVNLSAGGQVEVILKKADKVPGNVVCDIHKWMDAVVLVRDEPYSCISVNNGQFKLANLPAGKWKFQFWHKKVGFLRDLQVAGGKTGRRGEIELTIESGQTLDLGDIAVDASVFEAKK